MTASLSPAELDEVTRFGIHTPDILGDLGLSQLDDEPACLHGDAPATVLEVARCCGHSLLHCAEHHVLERDAIELRMNGIGTRCKVCFHEWAAPDTFEDFIRVVAL